MTIEIHECSSKIQRFQGGPTRDLSKNKDPLKRELQMRSKEAMISKLKINAAAYS